MNIRAHTNNGVSEPIEFTWDMIRQDRQFLLQASDLWVLVDRYSTLTSDQQTELTNYRKALRDLTSDYSTANEAAENFPDAPSWLL